MPPKDTEGSNGLIPFVRRNQLVVFIVLAYALSWWAWIWYRLDSGNVNAPILPIGTKAALVLEYVGGESGVIMIAVPATCEATNSRLLGEILADWLNTDKCACQNPAAKTNQNYLGGQQNGYAMDANHSSPQHPLFHRVP